MSTPLAALLLFGILIFFHLSGGAAIGTGIRARRALPVLWGALIGGAPLYFGIERVMGLGAWDGLVWQMIGLLGAALAAGLGPPRLRWLFLAAGMTAIMVGSLIMAAGMLIGALLDRGGFEIASLILGGVIFLFGAMWFGSGIQQMRNR
jgi:hypothetical protein